MPSEAEVVPRPLRMLCLHGHTDYGRRMCDLVERDFLSVLRSKTAAAGDALPIDAQCRCVDAPFIETTYHAEGRQWWRYDSDQKGDRPEDWAEMEVAASRIAKEINEASPAYDGVLGMSQGAEMVHTFATLASRGDARVDHGQMPKFLVSLSGAVNPGHFEEVGGHRPPASSTIGWPSAGELSIPCLFAADFANDGWYSNDRLRETLALYADQTVIDHDQGHRMQALLDDTALGAARSFFRRFTSSNVAE